MLSDVIDVAITVHDNKLKSIKSVLNALSAYSIELDFSYYVCHLISREVNEINGNNHYHLLITVDSETYQKLITKTPFWYKVIETDLEIQKYINYVKKDGKFMVVNTHRVETQDNDNWYMLALKCCNEYSSLREIFMTHPELIKKVSQVSKLWDVINVLN